MLERAQVMNAPIGVFDSGLGGLTVLSALREALPGESFVYLGDVARLPYGTKSASVVNAYSQNCLRLLESYGVKLLVVACNTATALALDPLQLSTPIPVVGVIEGGVRAAVDCTRNQRILVLATDATVKNEAYLREFNRQNFQGQVTQIACPLLVPLAEEGWWEHEVTAQVIRHYLEGISEYDTIVLGCTHYPLLEPSFRKVLPEDISLVHGGKVVAEQVRQILSEKKQLSSSGDSTITFLATDSVSTQLPLLKLTGTLGKISFSLVALG
jgi:glutamate racemase